MEDGGFLGWIDRHERWLRGSLLVGFLASSLFAAATLRVEDDEVFYASAAWQVAHGRVPYEDFFFPQPPLSAYVYAPTQLLEAQPIAGRLLSVAMSLAALSLTMDAARRLAGPRAGLLAGAAVATAALTVLSAAWVHANPLAMLLVAAATWVLTTRLPAAARYGLAAAALALAAATRLNLVIALPILGACVLAAERGRTRLVGLVSVGAVATLVLVAVYGPFVARDATNLRFGLVSYHLLDGRDASHTSLQLVKFKLDGLAYFGAEFLFVAVASGFVAALVIARHWPRLDRPLRREPLLAFYALAAAAALGASLTKTFIQARYLIAVLPLVAVVLGAALDRVLAGFRRSPEGGHILAVLLAILLAAQPMLSIPHHVFTPIPNQSKAVYQSVATAVRASIPEDGMVLTTLAPAVQWGSRAVVPGIEMGLWGWYPTMPTDEARRLHVLNAEMALQLVRDREPDALVRHEGDFRRTPFPSADFPPGEADRWHVAFDDAVREGYVTAARFGDDGSVELWLRADHAQAQLYQP